MIEQVVSLCYVSKRNAVTSELCRIADLISPGDRETDKNQAMDESEWAAYVSSGGAFEGTSRDLIYGMSDAIQAGVRDIGVFTWHAVKTDDKWATKVDKTGEAAWSEVIETPFHDLPSLMTELRRGFSVKFAWDKKRELIFCLAGDEPVREALVITGRQATVQDHCIRLLDSCQEVPKARLNLESGTGSCASRYDRESPRRYLKSKKALEAQGTASVLTREEKAMQAIREALTRTELLSRKEKQVLRSALLKTGQNDLIESVSGKLGCPREEAEVLVRDAIGKMDYRLSGNKMEEMALLVLESGVDGTEALMQAAKGAWEEEQNAEKEKVLLEIEKAKAALTETQARAAKARRDAEETELALAQAREQLADTEARSEELRREMSEHLDTFRTDQASRMLERAEIEALCAAVSARVAEKLHFSGAPEASMNIEEIPEKEASPKAETALTPENAEETPAPQEDEADLGRELLALAQEMQRELKALTETDGAEEEPLRMEEDAPLAESASEESAGDCLLRCVRALARCTEDAEEARGLVMLLMAAYLRRMPLLFLGEGAERMAGFYSGMTCGKAPAMGRVRQGSDLDGLVRACEAADGRVVALEVEGEKIWDAIHVVERCPGEAFALVMRDTSAIHDVTPGVFQCVLPVMCDWFDTELMEPVRADAEIIGQEMELLPESTSAPLWIMQGWYPPAMTRRLRAIGVSIQDLGRVIGLEEDEVSRVLLTYVYAPLLCALGKREQVEQFLEGTDLMPRSRLIQLRARMGVF
ncbi:MAG: hypothetical protein IJ083_10400 [Clostridia bacterium]|nr:hypothetical protein [Clostridia bacterium]